MAITLPAGNFLSSERVLIKDKEIAKIQQAASHAASPDQITSLWEKIKDWFCTTTRVEAKHDIFAMFSPNTPLSEKIKHFKNLERLLGSRAQDYLCTEPYAGGMRYMLNVGGDVGKLTLFDCDTYDLVRDSFDHGGLKELFKETDQEQAWELLFDICSDSTPDLDKIKKYYTLRNLVKPDVSNNPFSVRRNSESESYKCDLGLGDKCDPIVLFQCDARSVNFDRLERALDQIDIKTWFPEEDQKDSQELISHLSSTQVPDRKKIEIIKTLQQRVTAPYADRFTVITTESIMPKTHKLDLRTEGGGSFALKQKRIRVSPDKLTRMLNNPKNWETEKNGEIRHFGRLGTIDDLLQTDITNINYYVAGKQIPNHESAKEKQQALTTALHEFGLTPRQLATCRGLCTMALPAASIAVAKRSSSGDSFSQLKQEQLVSFSFYKDYNQLRMKMTLSADARNERLSKKSSDAIIERIHEDGDIVSMETTLVASIPDTEPDASRSSIEIKDWEYVVNSSVHNWLHNGHSAKTP